MTLGKYIGSIPDRFETKVGNQNLERVRETKYLGKIIDQHLRQDNEITNRNK